MSMLLNFLKLLVWDSSIFKLCYLSGWLEIFKEKIYWKIRLCKLSLVNHKTEYLILGLTTTTPCRKRLHWSLRLFPHCLNTNNVYSMLILIPKKTNQFFDVHFITCFSLSLTSLLLAERVMDQPGNFGWRMVKYH